MEEEEILTTQVRIQKMGMNILTSPTTVWFVSLWVSSIITMISFNIARVGFNVDGIFGGPSYYAEIFLNYGLNAGSENPSDWGSGIKAWIIAPFLAIWIGVPLYIIRDAGLAQNGVRQDSRGTIFYAYFDEYVFGYEVNLYGDKGNVFYLGIVWLPIVMASFITIRYKKHIKRESSIVTRFAISGVISFWLANIYARITDPNFYYNWDGFWESLFEFRGRNMFVRSVDETGNNLAPYQGHYHPTSTATMLTLMHVIPIIIFGLMDAAGSIYRGMKREFDLYRHRQQMIRERLRDGVKKLPWEEDEEVSEAAAK